MVTRVTTRKRKEQTGDTAAVVRRKLKRDALRENATNETSFLAYKDSKANKGIKGKSSFIPRQREPNEADSITSDWRGTTYRTGDGDTVQHQRPGSDLSRYKSFGTQT